MARILLIDDTPEIAELLTYALRDRGYDVVSSGFDTAISELAQEHRADAVLLIPKPFTGAQVARALDELLSSRPSASP